MFLQHQMVKYFTLLVYALSLACINVEGFCSKILLLVQYVLINISKSINKVYKAIDRLTKHL